MILLCCIYKIIIYIIIIFFDTFLKKMPYILRKQKTRGYKVCKRGTRKCFSKRPLTKRMAKRQMRALYLHERIGAGTGGASGGKSRRKQNKRCMKKGGMFYKGQGAAAVEAVVPVPSVPGMMTSTQAAAAAEAAALVVAAAPPAVQLAVAQMPNAYAQFLRVSQNGTVDDQGVLLPEVRLNEIQETLAFPTPVLPPPPEYDKRFIKGSSPQHVLEQQTFGCPSGDFIRFKRQMREDEERKHHVSVKEYHKLQMSLLEHLCTAYDPTTFEGIQSIQNIGYEWKRDNQPDS